MHDDGESEALLTPEVAAQRQPSQQAPSRWRAAAEEELVPLLTFQVGGITAAIPTERVDSIANKTSPTPVPRTPTHVLGLVLQGESAVPVVDLARLWALGAEHAATEETKSNPRYLVVNHENMRVGLLCDRIFGVVDTRASAHREPQFYKGARLEQVLTKEVETPHGLAGVLDVAALLEQARTVNWVG